MLELMQRGNVRSCSGLLEAVLTSSCSMVHVLWLSCDCCMAPDQHNIRGLNIYSDWFHDLFNAHRSRNL